MNTCLSVPHTDPRTVATMTSTYKYITDLQKQKDDQTIKARVTRKYRLEVYVEDETTATTFVIFDQLAEKLLQVLARQLCMQKEMRLSPSVDHQLASLQHIINPPHLSLVSSYPQQIICHHPFQAITTQESVLLTEPFQPMEVHQLNTELDLLTEPSLLVGVH
ncbi:hypothetical protein LguiA_029557 [Lonicera macranthoides]